MSDSNPNFHHRRSIRLKGYDYSNTGLYFITICTQNRECLFGEIRTVGAGLCACPDLLPSGDHASGDHASGDHASGDHKSGDHASGDHASGDHKSGDHASGDHKSGDHASGDHASGDHKSGDHKSGDHASGDHKGSPLQEMVLNQAGKMIGKWYRELKNKFPDIHCHERIVMPNHFHCIIEKIGNCENYHPVDQPHYGPGNKKYDATIGNIVDWFKTMTTNEYIREVKNHGWKRFDGRLWQRNYWEHIIRDDGSYNQIAEYITENPSKWNNDQLNPDQKL